MIVQNPASTPIVVLSGPTRGLGRALFDQLRSQAYPLVAVGRDLTRISTEACRTSTFMAMVEVDFKSAFEIFKSSLAELSRIVQSKLNTKAPIVFISNASAIEPIGQAVNVLPSDLESAMRINCLAPLMIANTLAAIAKEESCSMLILNVSSGAGSRAIRGWQAYCAGKAAYKMGLEVLAAENSHIRLEHFDPGVMDTCMQKIIRAQEVVDMPEVGVFRAYHDERLLREPHAVAEELLSLMKDSLL